MTDSSVTNEVRIDRDSVCVVLTLISSYIDRSRMRVMFSRMRSKMTIVSLME